MRRIGRNDLRSRRLSWTSAAISAIALVATGPAAVLFFMTAHRWCTDHGWPVVLSVPMGAAGLAALAWWWCGPRRQREALAAFAEILPKEEWKRLLPGLSNAQERMSFKGSLEVWLVAERSTNAYALGTRHIVVTAGLAGEPPQRQAAIIAHELAHLRLGHATAWWLLERCMLGYEQLALDTVAETGKSRFLPGSLVTAALALIGFVAFALPLFLLRLLGVGVARRMEWEADRLAAAHGFAEELSTALSVYVHHGEPSADVSLLTWKVRMHTHPPARRRRAALVAGQLQREPPIAVVRRVAQRGRQFLGRTSRNVLALLLAPPIDCGTILTAWVFADIGALQSMINGAFAGAPSLLPLTALAVRGVPRRALKRPRVLRTGLALQLAAHGLAIAAPSLVRDAQAVELLDLLWLLGAIGVLTGVGTRECARVCVRAVAVVLLPGRYALRLLRSDGSSQPPPHKTIAEQVPCQTEQISPPV